MASTFKKCQHGRKSEYYSCRYYDRVLGKRVERLLKGCRDKGVAKSLAMKYEREAAMEDSGQLLPRRLRQAQAVELSQHLREYLDDLKAKGRVPLYLRNRETYISTVFRECGWRFPQDINAADFIAWRVRQHKAFKTLNDYLSGCVNFGKWMVMLDRMASNPFLKVEKADTKGKESHYRRALTEDECRQLLAVASPLRRVMYSLGLYCGLRRSETQGLRWANVTMGENSYICVPASLAKNRKTESLPVHPAFDPVLKEYRAAHPDAVLVVGRVPRMDVIREDFVAAGISPVTEFGVADFHSLRHTFVTQMKLHAVLPSAVQTLARHSDRRLSDKIYMSAYQLPLMAEVSKIPSFYGAPAAPNAAPPGDLSGLSLAGGGTVEIKNSQPELAPSDCLGHALAQPGMQDDNGARYRIRTCDLIRVRDAF